MTLILLFLVLFFLTILVGYFLVGIVQLCLTIYALIISVFTSPKSK